MADIFEQKGKRGARAKRPKPAKVEESVVMDEDDASKQAFDEAVEKSSQMSSHSQGRRIQQLCPILGVWTEAVIERGSVREGKWGTEFSLQLRFDDPSIPSNYQVNGKTIFTKVSLNPKSKILRDFCRFAHRNGILSFDEEYQKQAKDGSRGLMAERLKANLEELCGVWDPDNKELVGGKLAGWRCSVIVSSMIEWPPSSKFPQNYVHTVQIPEEANEGRSVIYSIFEISRLSAHVTGDKFVGDKSEAVEAPYYEDPDDDVPF